jgi:hypothetical protein
LEPDKGRSPRGRLPRRWPAVPDDQVEDHARHLIGPHVHPHVWLRGVYAQLPLDLRLLLGSFRGTPGCPAGFGVVVQRDDGAHRGHGGSNGGQVGDVMIINRRRCLFSACVLVTPSWWRGAVSSTSSAVLGGRAAVAPFFPALFPIGTPLRR